jgi:hypothetical protein
VRRGSGRRRPRAGCAASTRSSRSYAARAAQRLSSS